MLFSIVNILSFASANEKVFHLLPILKLPTSFFTWIIVSEYLSLQEEKIAKSFKNVSRPFLSSYAFLHTHNLIRNTHKVFAFVASTVVCHDMLVVPARDWFALRGTAQTPMFDALYSFTYKLLVVVTKLPNVFIFALLADISLKKNHNYKQLFQHMMLSWRQRHSFRHTRRHPWTFREDFVELKRSFITMTHCHEVNVHNKSIR